MLVQWDLEKGLPVDDTNLTLIRKEAIMQEIAFAMHCGKIGGNYGRKEAMKEEIIPIVASTLNGFGLEKSKATDLFDKLIARSGIMVLVEPMTERYAFSHLTFQEFFTAKYINDNKKDIFEVINTTICTSSYGLTTWWREVLLLTGALLKDPSLILKKIIADKNRDLLRRELQISAQCLAEAVKLPDAALETQLISELLHIRRDGLDKGNMILESKELRRYLLHFAVSPEYYTHAFITAVNETESLESARELSQLLIGFFEYADNYIQLAAIDAFKAIKDMYDIEIIPDKKIIKYLLSANIETQIKISNLLLKGYMGEIEEDIIYELVGKFMKFMKGDSDSIYNYHRWMFDASPVYYTYHSEAVNARTPTICSILVEMMANIPNEKLGNILDEMKDLIREYMLEGYERYEDICNCSIMAIFNLDEDKKTIYKRELTDALIMGNNTQRAKAIRLLSIVFDNEIDINNLIMDQLSAPSREIRTSAAFALSKLKLNENQLEFVNQILDRHHHDSTRTQKALLYLEQMLMGKGDIGLSAENLSTLKMSLITLIISSDPIKRKYLQYIEFIPSWRKHNLFWILFDNKAYETEDVLENMLFTFIIDNDLFYISNLEFQVVKGSERHQILLKFLGQEDQRKADFAFELLSKNDLI